MTWEDLKIATLQRMFASTSNTLVENSSTLPYLNSMPQVANEALRLMSTAGKFIAKPYSITQDGTDTGLVQKYDLNTLTTDFFAMRDVYLETEKEYRKTTDFIVEGKGIFVLPSAAVGTWTIYYNAYPQEITSSTPKETVLAIDPEVAALMPLYMAIQLYKDDDLTMTYYMRQEFDASFSRLAGNANPATIECSSMFEGW